MLETIYIAVLLLIGYAGIKIVDQIIITGWRKVFGSKYVTEEECAQFRVTCPVVESSSRLEKEFKKLRRVLISHNLKTVMPADIEGRLEMERMLEELEREAI